MVFHPIYGNMNEAEHLAFRNIQGAISAIIGDYERVVRTFPAGTWQHDSTAELLKNHRKLTAEICHASQYQTYLSEVKRYSPEAMNILIKIQSVGTDRLWTITNTALNQIGL